MHLDVTERADDITQVALVGRLDISGLHEVDMSFHGITAAAHQPAIVDVSQLEFIASLGMGMLISCAQSLQRRGKKMVLVGAHGDVETALKTAGIDQAIPFATDIDDAVRIVAD